MTNAVSHDVRRVGAPVRADDPRLPDPVGSPDTWTKPVPDRIGESVARRPWALGLGAAGVGAGALLLTRRLGGGLALQIAAGAAGALGGALGGGWLASRIADAASGDETASADRPVATDHVVADEQLKVMSYNIRGGMGQSGFGTDARSLDAVAEEIRAQHPDIVLLQEVDDFTMRSSWNDNLAELNRRLHPDSIVAADTGRLGTGRSESVAVMTFNGARVTDARNVLHPDPSGDGVVRRARATYRDWTKLPGVGRLVPMADHIGAESYSPANTLDALVHTAKGNDVRVMTAHYMASNREHDFQATGPGSMVDDIRAWRGTTIMGADFNVRSQHDGGAREASWMADAGLVDTFTAAGHPRDDVAARVSIAGSDEAAIDRIYVPSSATVRDSRVIRDDPAPSDHHPVVATIDLLASR